MDTINRQFNKAYTYTLHTHEQDATSDEHIDLVKCVRFLGYIGGSSNTAVSHYHEYISCFLCSFHIINNNWVEILPTRKQ